MIMDSLVPKLRERFTERGLRVGTPLNPCAAIPAIHAEVGDVVICDEGHELMLEAGNFTHSHFSN